MKRILPILILLLLVGCGKDLVYRFHPGDIVENVVDGRRGQVLRHAGSKDGQPYYHCYFATPERGNAKNKGLYTNYGCREFEIRLVERRIEQP